MASKGCCSCISTFQAPKLPCVRSPCDARNICDDLLNASVQAIITVQNPGGLTADEILNEIMALCSVANISEADLDLALSIGARRGVLKRTIRDGLAAFLVSGNMTLLNPQNIDYSRCLCEFYRERGVGSRPQDAPNCARCAIPISLDGISDTQPVPVPCSFCPDGCFSNTF